MKKRYTLSKQNRKRIKYFFKCMLKAAEVMEKGGKPHYFINQAKKTAEKIN